MSLHRCEDLIRLFNHCFTEKYQVQLVGGADEPLYMPATPDVCFHTIYFTKDYFRSALHECAHWFIAGAERRKQVDYGYWYEPDGRDAIQQLHFQQVEVKPQAIECILSKAARHPFRVSLDNLDGQTSEVDMFEQAVFEQVRIYEETGLPLRAEVFRAALEAFYGGCLSVSVHPVAPKSHLRAHLE